MKDWAIRYYGSGCFIYDKLIRAKTQQDALRILNESEKVIEIIWCKYIGKGGYTYDRDC